MMNEILMRNSFGPHVNAFLSVVDDIRNSSPNFQYSFMRMDAFGTFIEHDGAIGVANKIYWEETLDRLHFAAVASIRRNYGWMRSVATMKEIGEATGYIAALRSLIEATADTCYSLVPATKTFARQYRQIEYALGGGASDAFYASPDMEEILINFSHGRKTKKEEGAPASHKAKQSFEYINLLKDYIGLEDIKELNEFLNGIVHPAANSVMYQISLAELNDCEVYQFMEDADLQTIEYIEKEYRNILYSLPSLCLDPALIAIRALHKIKRYPVIRSLRKMEFQQQKLWSEIEAHLAK